MNDKLGFDFTNLVAICTDGAPAMCGKFFGAVALLEFMGGKYQNISALYICRFCVAKY
jgi:hypothetical protein